MRLMQMTCYEVKKKRGFILIATLFFMLAAAVIGISAVSIISKESDIGMKYYDGARAFYVAEAGMQFLMEKLAADTDWSNNLDSQYQNVTFGPGTFSVHYVTKTGSTATLEVTGYVGSAVRVVRREISRTPAAFQYIAFSGNNLNLNASNGAAYQVDATGTIKRDANGNPLYAAVGSGADVHIGNMLVGEIEEHCPFPAPTVDFSYYRSHASPGQLVIGDKDFNAGTSYSGIWYVTGKVTINAGATVNGTIVAEGNITIRDNVTVQSTLPNPGLVSMSNISFNTARNVRIGMVMYAGNNIDMNNSRDVIFSGTVIADNITNMNSATNLTMYFYDGIWSTPPSGFSGTDIVKAQSWSEQ